MSNTVLEVCNLRVEFPTDEKLINAVQGINVQVKRGQTLGIVGESGSGKSVTALAIMGLLPNITQVGGEIWLTSSESSRINLLSLEKTQKEEYRGSQVAMIFQEPMTSLNPVFTIGFQLTEAIIQHQQVSQSKARRLAASLLQEVKLLPPDSVLAEEGVRELQNQGKSVNDRLIMEFINTQKRGILNRYPHELSGGQLQRVMIAMAISCNPMLLIADEPTTALDVTVQATILDLLRELRDSRGMAIIFITHDLRVIAEIADSVAVMYRGKIVEQGDVLSVFTQPQHPYTKGLLACRPPLDHSVDCLATVADFMEVIEGEGEELIIKERKPDIVNQIPQANAPSERDCILQVENLRVGFPVQGVFGEMKRFLMAVNDVSFQVYQGETLGLVGESGCGKSTLARTLLQLIPPTSGRLFFQGEEVTPPVKSSQFFGRKNRAQKEYEHQLKNLRRRMQIIFQDPFSSLDPRFNIGEAVMEPLVIHQPGQSAKEKRERTAYLLERVGLNPDWMSRYPHEFSGGQRQRICIARALTLNPKFVICDESVSALDVSVQAQVLNLLKELQREFNLTYIFISHDLSVVKFMSNRIMVMNQGRVEEIDQAEEVYYAPKTDYTRRLIASIPTGNLDKVRQRSSG